MNITRIPVTRRGAPARRAFTLVEMVVCMAIMGVVFVALYAAIAQGYKTIGLAREDLRATQILLEKTELTRLYTWSQATNSASFPAFTVNYYPNTNGLGQGVTYSGTYKVTSLTTSTVPDKKLKDENYASEVRVVTITLNWTSGNLPRSRSLSTLVSAKGIQNYVY
jgi:prepilin-type N-terminal cleavage/methylation domain-containing protein